ncbi:MAG: aspartyl protease family protein [Robiginitomaculum sp.]|nr:aspartyl protease family protein [Robiginitomaculum sp.]
MTALGSIKTIRKLVGIFTCVLVSCVLVIVFSTSAFANTKPNVRHSQWIPFERTENGQYTIKVNINGDGPFIFMVDTAASRTSIFNKTRSRLKLEKSGEKTFINGITASSFRPNASVDSLEFAGHVFRNHTIVILKDWKNNGVLKVDGILGMDVFKDMVFAFRHKKSRVKISRKPKFTKSKYRNWIKIRLEDNPYPVDKFGLLFTYTKLGDLHIPTLLDTGSNFSAINWMSVQGTSISKERRRLREEWVIQGSIGQFKPRIRVKLEQTFIGGVRLRDHEFLVMNFDNFPVNDYGKYPLVIVGVDLFEGRDFVLDFPDKNLYLAKRTHNISVKPNATRIKQ